jgi:ankyrin repeat protein
VGTDLDGRILRDNEGFLTQYGKTTAEKNCKDLGSGYYRHCWKYTKPNEKGKNGTWNLAHEDSCNSLDSETETEDFYDAICSTKKRKDCFKPFISPDFISPASSPDFTSPFYLMNVIDEGNLDQVTKWINEKRDLNFIYTEPTNPPKFSYHAENSEYAFHGYSPLNWAVKKFSENPKAENLKQIIIKLLESGANPNLPLSHQYDTEEFGEKSDIIKSYKNNDLQYTPLHFAVLSGDVDVVRELMSKGASTSAKGREPKIIMEEENGEQTERYIDDVYVTPIDLAIKLRKSKELVDLMLPHQDE